jgi:phage FluMu protein Com
MGGGDGHSDRCSKCLVKFRIGGYGHIVLSCGCPYCMYCKDFDTGEGLPDGYKCPRCLKEVDDFKIEVSTEEADRLHRVNLNILAIANTIQEDFMHFE